MEQALLVLAENHARAPDGAATYDDGGVDSILKQVWLAF
jgi:hypothetical protein